MFQNVTDIFAFHFLYTHLEDFIKMISTVSDFGVASLSFPIVSWYVKSAFDELLWCPVYHFLSSYSICFLINSTVKMKRNWVMFVFTPPCPVLISLVILLKFLWFSMLSTHLMCPVTKVTLTHDFHLITSFLVLCSAKNIIDEHLATRKNFSPAYVTDSTSAASLISFLNLKLVTVMLFLTTSCNWLTYKIPLPDFTVP